MMNSIENQLLTVLHVAPTPFFSDRGCHMRIRGIVRGLMEQKSLSCVVCTYNLGRDIDNIETVRIAPIFGYTKQSAGPSSFKYIADILMYFKVCKLIVSRRPQIMHAHLHEGALIAWAAKWTIFWRKIPVVFDMQGSLLGELEAYGYFRKFGFLKPIFWLAEYLITRIPDHIVCSSENSLDVLRDQFKVKAKAISLVNDGTELFENSEQKPITMVPKLLTDRPVVIYAGSLLEAKGLTDLCNTILEARKRNLMCNFLIVGYPEQAMLEFRDRNGLQECCVITGRVPFEQLGQYLALADIAIEPKLSKSGEASGKLLNYMGAGLPVVCFDTLSNRQMLGESGYYAATKNISSMVDQIQLIYDHPRDGAERGAIGRTRVEREFSWDSAIRKILAVYQSCLAG